tara:strand:+ start:88 stop:393 length:306 start_codon:yes stop_codon:yes gene_type:complete
MNNGRESLKENQHKVTAEIQVLRPGLDGKLIVDPNQQKIVISREDPTRALARWVCRRDAMQEAGWQTSLWGAVRVTLDTGESLVLRATFESPARWSPLESE